MTMGHGSRTMTHFRLCSAGSLELSGELLAAIDLCRTDNSVTNIPIRCLPPCLDPEVLGLDIFINGSSWACNRVGLPMQAAMIRLLKLKPNKALDENSSSSHGASPAMGSRSITCHPTQVNAPRLNPSQ